MIDLSLSIDPQAWAVLHSLQPWNEEYAHDYPDATIRTFAMYNGREKGICLEVTRIGNPNVLLIAFGEDRKSDQLFVWIHEKPNKNYDSPPRVEDFPEESYKKRRYFDHFRIDIAVAEIHTTIDNWLET